MRGAEKQIKKGGHIMSKYEIIFSDGTRKIEEYNNINDAWWLYKVWNSGVARLPSGAKHGTVWAVTIRKIQNVQPK